jgi:signal transduction histidine kinase
MPSVDETLEEVRNISKNLYPNQLEKYGLVAAVNSLAEKVKESSALFVSHDLDAFNENISSDTQIHIYRIIQECISNTLKHAEATAMRITANTVNGIINLVIQDNGKGIDKSILANKAQRSFGLLNLEERAKLLNGSFELVTAPGKGTKCVFTIPV